MIGNKTGKLGEDIVERFLKKHDFDVFTRNFLKPYGEIDIIAGKSGVTHFIEVKSVSREIGSEVLRETVQTVSKRGYNVLRETQAVKYESPVDVLRETVNGENDSDKSVLRETLDIRPEDNLHSGKLRKLSRVIQSYISSNKVDKWQFDLYVVYIDKVNKKAEVKVVENLVLEE